MDNSTSFINQYVSGTANGSSCEEETFTDIRYLPFADVLNIDTTYNRVPDMCKETLTGYHFIKSVHSYRRNSLIGCRNIVNNTAGTKQL